MTQNITFKDWEAEQMQDPEFRAAVEELEPKYQNERRQMNVTEQVTSVTGADIDAAIEDERIIELERRIGQLETCAVIDAETVGHVAELRRAVDEQAKRIEKLWQWVHE